MTVAATATQPNLNLRDLRLVAFVVMFLLSWIGVDPFPNLTPDTLLEADKAASLLNLFAYLLIGGGAIAIAFSIRPEAFRAGLQSFALPLLGWLIVSVITSSDPGLSLRRLTLTIIVMGMAIAVTILPLNLRQFARLLSAIALVILALCFAGGLLIPHLAIHQATDFPEPNLAGDWRGIYSHKNIAASIMVMFIFTGILTIRAGERWLGIAVIVLSLVFMFLAAGKTALAMLVPTLLLSVVVVKTRSTVLRAVIAIVPVLLINLATIGSVVWPEVGNINRMFLPDASFTGRTDIWDFALTKVRERPVFGFGFSAFWQTSATMFGGKGDKEAAEAIDADIVTLADHAHNAYLDVALTTGVPGLILTILWLIVQPLRDISRARNNGASPALLLYFVQIWLFCINFACLESLFYHRTDPVWFMLLIAVFGITALTHYKVRA